MSKNISYIDENIKFNFRVAAIINNNDKTLLQKCVSENYYSLIGGRVQLKEDTKTTLIRELEEETGIKVERKDISILKIMENFFTHNNIKFHEILYIYKVNILDDLLVKNDFSVLDKNNVMNKWIKFEDISNIIILPKIFKDIYNKTELTNSISIDDEEIL